MNDPFLLGSEPFKYNDKTTGITMLDFWRFQFSNVWDMQDQIAEFIVAQALGQSKPYNKNGWTLWDITYKGKRIEVKETAYYHSWRSDGKVSSHRTFNITKAYSRYKDSSSDYKRQNDIYVFCLNIGEKREDSDPLNLNNWRFWVIPTATINQTCGDNKTISLGRIQKITGLEKGIGFCEIKNTIDSLLNDYSQN